MEFLPVRPARASDEVVSQIQAAIFAGRFRRGDRLPPEREMAEQFGVSRATVRDALRSLEAAGLVRIRVGGQGGPYVAEPDVSRLIATLETHVHLQGTTFMELAEARLALELMAARLAADRATGAELEAIRSAAERSPEAHAETAGELLDFHHLVVAAAHNGALLSMWTATRRLIQEPFDLLHALRPEMATAARRAHRKLYRALAERDRELAVRLTDEHLSDFAARAQRAFEESQQGR